MEERKCCICGRKYPERWMMTVFTGRTHWWCWDCYKAAHGEAAVVEIRVKQRRAKEIHK